MLNAIFEVESAGVGLSIQDAGRPGWRRYGVAAAGAMDRHALEQANRLLGNLKHTPALEVMYQGARLRVLVDTWIALTGADLGLAQMPWTAWQARAGSVLNFTGGAQGLWAYLAIPGGIDAVRYFGSVSQDTRSGIGQKLQAGDLIYGLTAPHQQKYPQVARRILRSELQQTYPSNACFRLLPGPQFASFSDAARDQLVEQTWTVSNRSDRTGYRLDGACLPPAPAIHSEPVLPGSFQVTSDGIPIVTMQYGPTVGGYPKLAVLHEADLGRFAQCRPGTELKFLWDAY